MWWTEAVVHLKTLTLNMPLERHLQGHLNRCCCVYSWQRVVWEVSQGSRGRVRRTPTWVIRRRPQRVARPLSGVGTGRHRLGHCVGAQGGHAGWPCLGSCCVGRDSRWCHPSRSRPPPAPPSHSPGTLSCHMSWRGRMQISIWVMISSARTHKLVIMQFAKIYYRLRLHT